MNIREVGSIDPLNVVVHVIDQQNAISAEKSQGEIDVNSMDPKISAFIIEHIRTSILNNESKLCKFEQRTTRAQLYINEMIQNPGQFFLVNSQRLADLLFSVTPQTATPGCIVVVHYTNTTENFIAIIKLDKNDAIAYELKEDGRYDLVLKGTSLPLPSKTSKLHKFAVVRDTSTIPDADLDTKPALIVLDKQMANPSLFFYRDFLKAEFLLTDSHKSEKLMDGIITHLKSEPNLDFTQKQAIIQSFGNKIINGEEFVVDEAARQLLSPYYEQGEELEHAIVSLENSLRESGLGDHNLRGVCTPKIERLLGIVKIKTTENINLNYPSEFEGTKVIIRKSEDGDGQDIFIRNVHIKNN